MGKMFNKPKRKVTKVFIHCSASDNTSHDLEAIRQWHFARGFRDIGYHFVITKYGEIQKGRNLEWIPAAQKGHNAGSIAICVCGLKTFTKESLESLVELCKEINKSHKNITFHGHCEVNPNKTCPVFDYKALLNLNKNGKMNEQISFRWFNIFNFLFSAFNKKSC